MKAALCFCVLMTAFSAAVGNPAKKWGLFSRHYRSGRPTELARCIDQVQVEGTYRYISTGESDPGLCSIYILSPPDKIIEIDVQEMNIDCNGGLIGLLDGWELNQEVFPGWLDGSKSREERLKFFCGESGPSKPVVSSQNLINIKHRIPNLGEGFTFTVRFIDNPEPCNVLLMEPTGAYTLQNFGKARNCSVSILHPEKVNILGVDIGSTIDGKHHKSMGVRRQCMESGERDYAEFLFGSGMQPDYMRLGDNDMCGTKHEVGSLILLPCGYSVVRLVSSGQYVNSISFRFDRVTDDEFVELAAMGHTFQC
ncbi:corticotropin-releasing factor-binding protein-like [Lineus longissimus]|uniref:corticotropin-releasing factor-binding protein-like n=1 Tax=Lineus longissimus TaxID=88925 RepID=UPI002B4D045F